MGITTLVKNYFVYFILALSLFGYNDAAYSQCPTVANGSQSFCDTQSPTVADLQATDNGGGVRWYASAVSVTPLSSGAALQNGEDYFADDNTGACGARQSTIVTIYSAPVADPFQGPCVENLGDATLEDFVAIGNNIQWYANSTGGSPLPITTVIVNGTLYYASQMNPNGLCESSRRPVRAVVGYVPTPTGSPVQNFCNVAGTPPTVADLAASGNNNWYLNSFSSVPLALTTQLINGHSYFATTVDPPCESSNRLEVLVNIYEPNDAGTNGQRRICSDQIATTPPFDLFNELGGSPDNTGVWTGPIATTNGAQGTLNVSTMNLAGSPYVFTYTVSNPACANTVSTVTITINPQPTVTVTSPVVCSNVPATVTATPTPAGTYSYVWTVPVGATNPGNVATFTTSVAGTYSVIATNATSTCPSASASTTVVINPIPTVTVTSPPVCSGTPATVTAIPTPAGTYSYVWTVPVGATNPGNVATFTTSVAGTYSVIATDTATTCPSASASTTVVINPIPTVTVTSPPVCSGTPATVTAIPTPAGTYSYVWTVPVGATNPGNVATFTTSVAGTYSVIATDTATTCPSASASTTVVINPIPTVTVTSPPVCSGTPATVTATPTPAGTYSYIWTVPVGATNPGNVATFTTSVAGTYSVIATSTTTTCPSASASTTVVINPIPTVTVTSPPVCSGTLATVTAIPTPAGTYSYVWTVPVGATNPGNVATFSTSVAGTYSVIATNATSTCPSLSASTTVVINPIPTVTVTSPPVCSGTPATVTATPTPAGTYSYVWTVPVGATNPGNVATFTTSVAGTYSVIATDTATTCPSASASTTVVINPIPTVTVTSPPVCSGTPATVTAIPTPAGTYSYVWTVPVGATNPGNVATFTTSVAGTYSVIATDTATTCPSASASTTVVINPIPTVTVTSPPVCSGTPATVTATPTPAGTYSYIWTVPVGATNPGNVATFTTSVAGTYSVIATSTTTTCPSASASTTVVINPIPTVTVTSPPVCSGTPATVTAIPTPAGTYSYVWTVPVGATNPGNVATFSTSVAGTYSVIATNATSTCPSLSASTTVVINPIPTVTVTSPPVCSGTPATVTATPTPAGTYSYVWTVPVGATNPGNVATFTTSVAGTYSVIATDTATTCPSASASTTVVINPIPTVTVTSPPVCSGTPATVTATPTPAGTYSYIWTVPVGATNPGNVATFTTSVAGTYSVIATNATSTCPSLSASTTVVINPIPTVTVTSPPVCSGTPATVTAIPTPAGTYSYVWTVPVGATNPGNVATFTTSVAGTYSVIATDTATTCPSASASTTVVINPIPTVTVTSPPVCSGTPATVTAIPTPAGTYSYVWTVPVGATNPGNVATFTTSVAGTYSVIATSTTATCPSASTSTTVVINPTPNAGNDASLPLCSNQNPVDLFPLLGVTAQPGGVWTDPSNTIVTNIINPATAVSGNYTYTVTGIAPCADDTATIAVTIAPGPEAGISGPFSICTNSAPHDLFLELGPDAQPGGTWSPALDSGTGFFNPLVDAATDYTYTLTGTNPCDNDEATITVSILPVPDAGTGATDTICTNDSPVDLFTYLGGTPQTGGVWTDPSNAVVSNMFDPAVGASGDYTYTVVGGAGCPAATAIVSITVLQSPNAGGGGAITACIDNTGLDLINALDGTQGAGTFSDDDSTGALSGTIFNPSLVAPGIYHFTYTVGGGAAPCLFDTALVTVTVEGLPNGGTFVPGSPICNAVGTIDLNTLLQNQDANGLWYDVNGDEITNPVTVSSLPAATYDYYYVVSNNCGSSDPIMVTFEILPNPEIISSNISIAPVCINNDVTVSLSGMVDGTYTLNYDLSGSNTLANQTATVTVTGGTASFVIPTANVPVVGNTTITFINIQNTVTSCQATLTNVTGNIIINPIVQIDNTTITVANVCLGSAATVTFTNAVNLPDGEYQFDYTIPTGTPTTGNSGNVTIAGGSGSFTIPATVFATVGNYSITINTIITATGCSNTSEDATANFTVVTPLTAGTFSGTIPTLCTSVGVVDLTTLLTGQSAGGVWTDSSSQVVLSQINIVGFTAGTYSYTYTVSNACGTDFEVVQFTVLATPTLSSLNLTVPSICIGANGNVNFSGMADGTYTLNYDLGGSNPLANQQVIVTIFGGSGSFSIPSSVLPNIGTTIISFTNIINNTNSCFNLVNVTASLVIKSFADIDSPNLNIANVCIGDAVIVNITNAINLPDDTYQFNYSIPGATPVTGNSGNVSVVGGVGQFTVPGTVFTTAGNYTLTIFGIIATSGCTNATENASANFTINGTPDVTGAILTGQDTCLNFDSIATISGAINLPDGSYTIEYDLSGANTATAVSTTVNFVSGLASVVIPGAGLTNEGATTITITQVDSATSTCSGPITIVLSASFNVSTLAEPVLITDGAVFCDDDHPTVANLTANIVGGQAVLWYNASTGGNVYDETELLVEGTIYYAAAVAQSGCESASRLPVTADLSGCDELVFPDGFSPNDDAVNNTFIIKNLADLYPNFKLEIYNRYGNLVYEGNINTPNWDGTSTQGGLKLGSNLLPTGVYFYIVYFNDGARKPYQDRVYLSR